MTWIKVYSTVPNTMVSPLKKIGVTHCIWAKYACPISQVVRPQDGDFLLLPQAVLRQAMWVTQTTGARSTAWLRASLPNLAQRVGASLPINVH